jgi:hypothetical protein
VISVRSMQERYGSAHLALTNWAKWSRDRKQIGPRDSKPHIWQEAATSKFDDFGDIQDAIPQNRLAADDRKAEYADEEPYNEREGAILDERIHGPGGLLNEVRHLLRIAYVTRDVPEYQFPRACGCPPHAFLERLEAALVFVGRFA